MRTKRTRHSKFSSLILLLFFFLLLLLFLSTVPCHSVLFAAISLTMLFVHKVRPASRIIIIVIINCGFGVYRYTLHWRAQVRVCWSARAHTLRIVKEWNLCAHKLFGVIYVCRRSHKLQIIRKSVCSAHFASEMHTHTWSDWIEQYTRVRWAQRNVFLLRMRRKKSDRYVVRTDRLCNLL